MRLLKLKKALLDRPFPTPGRYLEGTLEPRDYALYYMPDWHCVLAVWENEDTAPVLIPRERFLYWAPEDLPGACECKPGSHKSQLHRLTCKRMRKQTPSSAE